MGCRHLLRYRLCGRQGRKRLVGGGELKERRARGGHRRRETRGGRWRRRSIVMERLGTLMCWLFNSEQHLEMGRARKLKEKHKRWWR
jgi:hypothetical protein